MFSEDLTKPVAVYHLQTNHSVSVRLIKPGFNLVVIELGRVAGSQSTHQGEGGANYICLPLNPEYNKPVTQGYHSRASLFGVEYGHVEDLFARMGQGPRISYLGVPCAVCRAEKRGSLMMIPARNVCPTRQWTREYQGYLMTGSSNGTRQEYICVDNDATGVNVLHSKNHSGKALLTSVLGKCGVLPCPPYEQDRELTCAVCTIWPRNFAVPFPQGAPWRICSYQPTNATTYD